MLVLNRRIKEGPAEASLTLSLEQRERGRLRVVLDDGRDAGIFLERGQVLRHGDLIGGPDGLIVEVRAANEEVSCVDCDDPLLLSRICYHLGNRHVALQIRPGQVCYRHDRVLDDMVAGLGGRAHTQHAPFDPEPGAYSAHSHPTPHSHDQ